MAENITPFSISAPGFYGLNLNDSPVDLTPNFALEANNCVIDKSGRIAARKGWTAANSASTDLSTGNVECIGELIENAGTATTLCAGNGYLYKLSSGALSTLVYDGGGVAPTISANNWKFCFLNGIAMFWQRGYDPLIYDPARPTKFRRLSEQSGATGITTGGAAYLCNEAISAYGRVWAADVTADKSTVIWSDLLTPHIWTGGTSGSLDLRNIWPHGGDEIVALAAHNNYLFIFGRRQILVYEGADVPATMRLKDSIVGIGCIARDSVQNIGEDVWFLSDTGVRSLLRTIQEKSSPIRKVSKNVNDDIQAAIKSETLANVKSGYSKVNNFYLLTMPASMKTYCFDTRIPLEDSSARTTLWTGTTPKAFYETKGLLFYTGRAGYIGTYAGYTDNAATYRMTYYTTWIDFGNPIQTSILKRIILTAIGGGSQVIIFKWAYDYTSTYFTGQATLNGASLAAQYNVSEYNTTAEYDASSNVNVLKMAGSSHGRVLQFGFETDIDGYEFAVQRIDLFCKEGRL
jgi:hypothetical protein